MTISSLGLEICVSQPDRYRSRGERQIAGFLDQRQIPFEYEHPLALFHRDRIRLYYPDFYLPGQGLFIEYFGMLGNNEYENGLNEKLAAYQANQATVLSVYPFNLQRPDWGNYLENQIDLMLSRRLNEYRQYVTATPEERRVSLRAQS